MKRPGLQRGLLIVAMSGFLAVTAFCGYMAHTLSAQAEAIRRDYSATNNIGYGILSVNKWRDLVIASVSREIQDFTLTPAERDSLKKEVSTMLNGLVDKADSLMNAPKKSIGGKLEKLAYHTFVKKSQLRDMVPGF